MGTEECGVVTVGIGRFGEAGQVVVNHRIGKHVIGTAVHEGHDGELLATSTVGDDGDPSSRRLRD